MAVLNIRSARENNSDLFNSSSFDQKNNALLKNKLAAQSERKNNLATAPLANVGYLTDTEAIAEEELYGEEAYAMSDMPASQSQVFLASYSSASPVTSQNSRQARIYEVKDGDTVGKIAALNGISVNTILWANGLSETSVIKPGDKLAVLPVTGIKYKVQKGDSLDTIAGKYNSDKQKIMTFNELPADGSLKEGQNIVLPDGYISAPTPSVQLAVAGQSSAYGLSQRQYSATAGSSYRMDSRASGGHRFPYGYCTWYVAQRKYVPWGGNAGSWLANARASGKATGSTPRPGAIMVSGESRWGHVAIVESVSGSSFTVSEMNYAGFGKKSTRTISAGSRVVKGFIY